MHLSLGDASCLGSPDAPVASLAWLIAATSYEKSADGYDLRDRYGAVVAHLAVDGNPPTQSDLFPDELTDAPEVTDEVRALFPELDALPEDATPPSDTDLLGRWQPLEVGDGDPPFVELAEDGSWTGSDGCNRTSGRWLLGTDGHFLGTGGFSTQIGCLNSPAPSWVSTASLAGMVGDELVLYDASGTELGVLVRP